MTQKQSIADVDIDNLARELEENAAKKVCHPSAEEAVSLIGQFKNGNRAAFNALVNRNQRLVISIADHYTSDPEFLKDLVQEGNLGLIRAIEKFEHGMQTKFSTYAAIWIRSNIEAHISKVSYNMKVPQNSRKLASKVFKIYDRVIARGVPEHEATSHVAEEAGISCQDAKNLIALRTANVKMQDRRSGQVEDGDTIQDTIESNVRTEDGTERERMKKMVENLVFQLPTKQREAISFFYGVSNYPECGSHSEVARHMGVTREYARILYNKGVAELTKIMQKGEAKRDRVAATA